MSEFLSTPMWTRRACNINPLYAKADGNPTLTELDALLVKGHKAGDLNDRDSLGLEVLRRRLGWSERDVAIRLDLVLELGYFGDALKLKPALETVPPPERWPEVIFQERRNHAVM
jgi:hypothetical protein